MPPTRRLRRIISLVPSDTYTLARLGVGDRLVGRTEYCVLPEEILAVEAVGGTKNADVARIVALAPDLVIANQEENRKLDIDAMRRAGLEVLLSFPCTVRDGLAHAERLAALFPELDNADMLARLAARYHHHAAGERREPVPTFVPIWNTPLMTANHATFLSDVVRLCGGRNVFAERERRYPLRADMGLRAAEPAEGRDTRYPRVTLDEVEARRPALVLLPDEPYAFSEADARVFALLPSAPRVQFVGGKSLMWYGLRALEDLDEVASWFGR